MKHIFRTILGCLVITSFAFSQQTERERKIKTLNELRSQIASLEAYVLSPDPEDSSLAASKGFKAFRLLPREKYDGVLTVRGGGAYYSFSKENHNYDSGTDISLERERLTVGFAGADYGFLQQLGELDLSDLSADLPSIEFLVKYQPPKDEPSIRMEQERSNNYTAGEIVFSRSVPAIVGENYALRSIRFGKSDVLVLFNIYRRDSDGNLIIFWKHIHTFDVPEMRRGTTVSVR
ncbi:MAG TPA: hypothetical protein PKD26_03635 [Pyrinomonadaceae bacterium]|nr:hypothetical protein [Pyrinomonadaceae bacterium]